MARRKGRKSHESDIFLDKETGNGGTTRCNERTNSPPITATASDLERMIETAVRAAIETMHISEQASVPTSGTNESQRFPSSVFRQTTPPEAVWYGEVAKTLPDFDPIESPHQTVDMWISRIDNAAVTYGWPERTTINVAISKLKGTAQTWYESLSFASPQSWDEWKTQLREWFPATMGKQKLHREMERRVRLPGENIECYFHDKMAKGRRCGLDEAAMIDYLITGLSDEKLVMALSTRDYDSPQQLLRFVKQMEERLEFAQVKVSAKVKNHTYDSSSQPTPRKVEIPPVEKNLAHQGSRRRKPKVNEMGQFLCFNCLVYGHVSKDCPKPQRRERCSICQRTGHRASECRLKTHRSDGDMNRPTISHLDDAPARSDANDKYFKEAMINGVAVKAYVDLGSRCVTVRLSTARDLKLSYEPAAPSCVIRGFGCGRVNPVGKAAAEIRVDQVQVTADVYVVPDEVQAIPLLIGQPVTDRPNVTVVKRKNTLRLFQENEEQEAEDECLRNIQIPELPPLSVNLWAKKATVIPPNYVGFIDVHTSKEQVQDSDILVEARMRFSEGQEYCIPRNVTTIDMKGDTAIPIVNISQKELSISKGQRIARAELCQEHRECVPITANSDEVTTRAALSMDDLNVGESVTEIEKNQLLALLNEYRDCFAENIFELGRTHLAKMKIELTTDKPVTFRPYRLSYAERDLVKDKISSLMAAGIVSESGSPYASPTLIVKNKTGEERLCIDSRALNKITKKDAFPLPLIDDQLERLTEKKVFTNLDLASGYYQVPVDKTSREKTWPKTNVIGQIYT